MDNFIAHILVVDDDDGIRSLVQKYLNENNYLVTTADNAENAIEKDKQVWSFEQSIDLAEPLGTETQLFFKLNNKEIISRMYNPRLVQVGEKIKFEIDITKIHFFDHETKKAI